MSDSEYTYGYNVYKETFLERMERAKGEEYDELVEYVRGKWDYDEENLDWIVDTAIDAGKSILMLINMKK